jgi:hypothetical protein
MDSETPLILHQRCLIHYCYRISGVSDTTITVSAVSQTLLLPYQRCFRHYCYRISGVSDTTVTVSEVSQTLLLPYQRCLRHYCYRISGVSDTTDTVSAVSQTVTPDQPCRRRCARAVTDNTPETPLKLVTDNFVQYSAV